MDGELTAIPSSTVEVVGGEGEKPLTRTPDSCREIFEKAFPSYLALGMTYDEYYRQDHTLVADYRIAYKRKMEQKNQDMWLQGAYVYEAIRRVAPLLIPFNEHPQEAPYLDKPFPMSGEEDDTQDAKLKAVADKGLAYMQAQMIKFNKKFGKKE